MKLEQWQKYCAYKIGQILKEKNLKLNKKEKLFLLEPIPVEMLYEAEITAAFLIPAECVIFRGCVKEYYDKTFWENEPGSSKT